jgi:LacI family transcriptional regulator
LPKPAHRQKQNHWNAGGRYSGSFFFKHFPRYRTPGLRTGLQDFFCKPENKPEKARALVKVFRERQVEAYIIAPPPCFSDAIGSLLDNEIPVILFDRYDPALKTANIVVDNYEGALKAVQHLRQTGYANIGFATLKSDQTQMHERMQGYLDGIKGSGWKKQVLQVPYLTPKQKTIAQIKAFLLKYTGLDAVFFSTNYLALSGLQAITDSNLKIPDALAVVSFDDSPVFCLFSPSITAVAQPVGKIAEAVINKVMACLNKPDNTTTLETLVVPTELIIRGSSARRCKN